MKLLEESTSPLPISRNSTSSIGRKHVRGLAEVHETFERWKNVIERRNWIGSSNELSLSEGLGLPDACLRGVRIELEGNDEWWAAKDKLLHLFGCLNVSDLQARKVEPL